MLISARAHDPAPARSLAAGATLAGAILAGAILAGGAAALFMPRPAAAQTDVRFRVERTGMVRVNLVLGDFTVHGSNVQSVELGPAARDIVRNDLFYSGLFNQQERHGAVPPEGKELSGLLDSLKAQGQDVLLAGDVTLEANAPHLGIRLYDTASGKLIDRSIHLLTRPDLRARAHELSDRIVLVLTGERGIATTRIAFVSNRTGTKELYVMDYDGEGVTELTRNGSINLSPDWAPAGSLLAAVSYLKGNADIYTLRPERPNLLSFAVSPALDSDPAFSPSGDRMAFTRAVNGNPDIYVGNVVGGQLQEVTRLTREGSVECCPTWAPGGGEIAFVSDRSGSPQVYVMQADGTNVRRITFLGNYNASPAWSPDGDKIAFASREDNLFSIFTVQPNGDHLTRLTASGDFEDPSWSPDGRHLAVASRREGRDSIYILGADGTSLLLISRGAGHDSSPAWGPWPPMAQPLEVGPGPTGAALPGTPAPAPSGAAPKGN